MKIAVCGAGLVGSYTYRLLRQAGFDHITVFDKLKPPKTSCGINPCAWATSIGFKELIEETGLDPAKYAIWTSDSMLMNELRVKAEVMVIHKPKLIADLLNGVEVLRSPIESNKFDRIIDATGYERAFLPPIGNDIKSPCVQYRVFSEEEYELGIDISNLGYAWRFPMSQNEYHIGAGSLVMQPELMLEKLGWLKNSSRICACTGLVRLTAPHFSFPFVDMKNDGHCPIWGVGEAIGCVAPLTGEGIIPGLKSARLLLANWDDPEVYQLSILKEFSWMKRERKIVDKVVQGKRIGLLDAQVLKNSTRRYRIDLERNQSLSLLRSVARTV